MNFKFANLLGAPYRGGSLLLHGTQLLSPVGNRVSEVNLSHSTSQTLPFENLKQIRTLCLSPDGTLLLSIDEDGRALLVNRPRRVLLAHFSFKGPVAAAAFSPDGAYVAVAVGRLLQVWHTPSLAKQLSPMRLHRTYGGCHDAITALDWSADSLFLAVASKDLTARVFSLHPIPGYVPPTLAGHREALVGVFFTTQATHSAADLAGAEPPLLLTVSRDGALFGWTYSKGEAAARPDGARAAVGGARAKRRRREAGGGEGGDDGEGEGDGGGEGPGPTEGEPSVLSLAGGVWAQVSRHFFMQRGAKLSCAAFHAPTGVLVAGFSNGLFELQQLPEFTAIHTLSISRERITSVAFNPAGDWIALGCAKLGQLLVWEWRSESYVFRQQGHYYDISSLSWSPDGALIATGADDAKVKVLNAGSGFCFVTFSDHTAPITAVRFLPSGSALLSASLDGTVRAFDLLRYRCFRTLTAPEPTQFGSLAVDPGGEVVAAGSTDDFAIYVWSLKTGRLLDVLAGHEGPVSGLGFSPTGPQLASCSWDKTVRTWDVFAGARGAQELLQHGHDALALAWRPDGKQLAASTLDGQIHLWDPREARLEGVIEGRRHVRGGRLASDRRTAGNLGGSAAFTSLAYSADGTWLLAGGNSKWVCMYDTAERLLLRRFQVSANRSLDGVLDVLNSKHVSDAGPLQLIDHDGSDDDDDDATAELLPPASLDPALAEGMPGAASRTRRRPAVRVRDVGLAPTGQAWAAAATEGLLLYRLDTGAAFDPTDLTEALTPAAFAQALGAGAHSRALLIALRLGEPGLLRTALLAVPPARLATVAAALPSVWAEAALSGVAAALEDSPHVEFLLRWVQALLGAHGGALAAAGASGAQLPVMRSLQQAVVRLQTDLGFACESNAYALEYLLAAGKAREAAGAAAAAAKQLQAAPQVAPALDAS